MANHLAEFSRQIKEKFLAGHTITTEEFYARLDTHILLQLLAGWERDFDEACGGDPYRQPKEWLQDRLHLLKRILVDKAAP